MTRRRWTAGAAVAPAAVLLGAPWLLAGCTGTTEPPASGPPVGLRTPTPPSTALFDCGRLDDRHSGAAARTRRLDVADTCLRDALTVGQPARFRRVTVLGGVTAELTYQVTGRGELAITEAFGDQLRHRRCTGATGLYLLGTCTRDPG